MTGFIDNALYEALPLALAAFSLIFTLRYLRIVDLTFVASFVLGPSIFGAYIVSGHGITTALFVACLSTILVSLLTSALTSTLDFDPLLAGIITSFVGYNVALFFAPGTLFIPPSLNPLADLKKLDSPFFSESVSLHPVQILACGTVVLFAKFLIDWVLQSRIGTCFRALEDDTGGPALLASLGISSRSLKIAGLIVANLLAMSSGLLVSLKEGQVSVARGFDSLLTVITAYLVGTVIFEERPHTQGHSSWITLVLTRLQSFRASTAVLFGLLAYFAILQYASSTSVPPQVPKLIFCGLLILAVALSRYDTVLFAIKQRHSSKTIWASPGEELRVRGVSVLYPGVGGPIQVLNSVSLDVRPGEVVRLVGPNGSGKSTLLKCIAGCTPGSGTIVLPSLKSNQSRSSRVAYIPQDPGASTAATLTTAEHIALFRTDRRLSLTPWFKGQKHVPEIFRSFQGHYAQYLSGGQRQLLSIVSLILRPDKPEVVLLDEPLTYLDPDNAVACVNIIAELQTDQRCVILVQHDLNGTSPAGVNAGAREKLAELVGRTEDLSELQYKDLSPRN
jgi:ABC-type Mn2+/Zn2+ transport system ATPase subunit/ABC-type uncharacterized transport system permease subunit